MSLRTRLPALFLAGVVLAGFVSAALAFRLFDDYTKSQALKDLNRRAAGFTNFYEQYSNQDFKRADLESATAVKIFYVPIVNGFELVPGAKVPFPQPPLDEKTKAAVLAGRLKHFEFKPAGTKQPYLAAAHPLFLGKALFGQIVVAKPKTELTSQLVKLFERLAIAFGVGIAIAGGLGVYLSRRLTEPVLTLAKASDEVARGNYDVELPARSKDEVGQLAGRFQEMARRLSEAEQRERNFLMTVSHELRTPLTAIRGHVAALREGVVEDPELAEASLEVISLEAGRLERLVGDVLDLAKLDAHRFTVTREEVDMGRLCEQAYAAFAEEARRRGIDYRSDARAEPVIVSDGDRVLQIITNLLSNAFRWTPDGGRIHLSLEQENGSVSVSVRDTGPGIPTRERERIFRPFFSGDGQGTGLGLAISKELAGALGGDIRLESTDGLGSRFELVLPAGNN
jgi:signal transduction histidine kinase